jgi:hypothetical protein
MKINCGRDWETLMQDRREWHPWFAWYPVRIGNYDCRFLEVVMRRENPQSYTSYARVWEYRAIEDRAP